jgi:hypothetical protein
MWDTPKAKITGFCIKCWPRSKHSEQTKEKLRGWRTDSPSYGTIHNRVRQMWGTASKCERCNTTNAKKFHWANLSGNYLLVRSDWQRLCVSCHHKLDKKYLNFHKAIR